MQRHIVTANRGVENILWCHAVSSPLYSLLFAVMPVTVSARALTPCISELLVLVLKLAVSGV